MSPVALESAGSSSSQSSSAAAQALESALQSWYQSRKPTDASLRPARELLTLLNNNLHLLNPPITLQGTHSTTYGQKYSVEPFGSVVTSLGLEGSDVDLVLIDRSFPHGFPSGVNSRTRHSVYDMDELAHWLRRLSSQGVRVLFPIRNAKVPLVKFRFTASDGRVVDADINSGNKLGVFNSKLINAYCKLSPHVRPLVLAVKHWAKQRSLNDPSGQSGAMSFSSYSLTLLVLVYLQTLGILPNLQDPSLLQSAGVSPSYFNLSQRGAISTAWATSFLDDPSRHTTKTVPGDTPLSSLLLGFFRWIVNLDNSRYVVNISRGGLTSKAGLPYAHVWSRDEVIVLDPFQLDRNTSGNVKKLVMDMFRTEADRAKDLLAEGDAASWSKVCESIKWDWRLSEKFGTPVEITQ